MYIEMLCWVRKIFPAKTMETKLGGVSYIGHMGWMGPRAGLEGGGKTRPPTGFDARCVHPVASRYTD